MRDAADPLIFLAWLKELNRQLFLDELGRGFPAYWGLRPLTVKRVLNRETKWCDDTGTKPVEPCNEILRRSLIAALKSLANTYGTDQRNWKSGMPISPSSIT